MNERIIARLGSFDLDGVQQLLQTSHHLDRRKTRRCVVTFESAYRQLTKTGAWAPDKQQRTKRMGCVQTALNDEGFMFGIRNRRKLSEDNASTHVPMVLGDAQLRQKIVSVQLSKAGGGAYVKDVVKRLEHMPRLASLNLSDNYRLQNDAYTAIAQAITTMGALTKLDVSNNKLAAPGTKAIADALNGNAKITELNIAHNFMDKRTVDSQTLEMSGASSICQAIPTMTALTKLVISGDISPEPTSLEIGMTEINPLQDGMGVGGWVVAAAWMSHKCNETLTSLDISGCNIHVRDQGVTALAKAIPAMKALKKFDVSGSRLFATHAQQLTELFKHNHVLQELNLSDNIISASSFPNMTNINAMCDAIRTMGALVKFDISRNKLCAEGCKAVAEALKNNNVIKKLNIAQNRIADTMLGGNVDYGSDMSGVIALSNAITTMGALTSLDISRNNNIGQRVPPAGWTYDSSFEVYFHTDRREQKEAPAGWPGKPEGAIALADAIGTNGALTAVNILSNNIGADQADKLIAIMASKPSLMTLCGFNGDETKLDLSNKDLSAGCGVLVANEVKNNGALTSLNISKNHIGQLTDEQGRVWEDSGSDGWSVDGKWPDGHSRGNPCRTPPALKAAGVIALAGAISASGALMKVDISANGIASKEAGKALAEVLKTNTVLNELDVSDNMRKNGHGHVAGGDGPGFAKELAAGVSANRALTSLNISSNNIGQLVLPEGWISRSFYGRQVVEVFIYRDGRRQTEDPGSKPDGAIAIADAISANGALAKLTFGGDGTYSNESTYWKEVPYEPATLEVGMTEADLSNKNLGIGGAIIVGAWISHKDNGALTSLNISNNELDHKGLEAIAQALTENKTLDVIT
jgi:Leucine-rich repeat (LRR) protein